MAGGANLSSRERFQGVGRQNLQLCNTQADPPDLVLTPGLDPGVVEGRSSLHDRSCELEHASRRDALGIAPQHEGGVRRPGLELRNFRGDACTSDAAMLRRWANLSALPTPYHNVRDRRSRGPTISGRGFNCFKPLRHNFRAFSLPFRAGRPKREGKKRRPSLPRRRAARSSGQEESAGDARKGDGARHWFDPFVKFKSTTAPALCTLFVLNLVERNRCHGLS